MKSLAIFPLLPVLSHALPAHKISRDTTSIAALVNSSTASLKPQASPANGADGITISTSIPARPVINKNFTTVQSAPPHDANQSLNDLINNESRLTVKAGLLARDPELQSVYNSLRNSTCFFPIDAAYYVQADQAGSPLAFRDQFEQRAEGLLQCVQGIWLEDSFNHTPTWVHSYLYNSSYTNVTDGQWVALGRGFDDKPDNDTSKEVRKPAIATGPNYAASLSLVRNGTSPIALMNPDAPSTPIQQISHIVVSDIPFEGGIVHLVDTPLTLPMGLFVTAKTLGVVSPFHRNDTMLAEIDATYDLTVVISANATLDPANDTVAYYEEQMQLYLQNSINGTVLHSDMFTPEGTNVTAQSGDVIVLTSEEDGTLRMNGVRVRVPDVAIQNGAIFVTEE